MLYTLLTLTIWSLIILSTTDTETTWVPRWVHVLVHLILSLELYYLAYCLYYSCHQDRLRYWLSLTLLLGFLSGSFVLHFWAGIAVSWGAILLIVTLYRPNRTTVLQGTAKQDPRSLQADLDQQL